MKDLCLSTDGKEEGMISRSQTAGSFFSVCAEVRNWKGCRTDRGRGSLPVSVRRDALSRDACISGGTVFLYLPTR